MDIKLIRISAVWCPACLIMRSRMKKKKKRFPNFEHIEYDYDLDEDIISKYKVGDILPVFILLDDDKEVTRLVGEKSVEEIENKLRCFEWKK